MADDASGILGGYGAFLSLPDDNSLEQSQYDFNHRTFPNDLGKPGWHGHYMVININVSNHSNFGSVTGGGKTTNYFRTLGDNELSKVDALRNTIDKQYTGNGQPLGYGSLWIPRFTRRIVESIGLYMPGTMTFSTNNVYEDVSLTELGKSAISWGASIAGSFAQGALEGAGRSGAAGTVNAAINTGRGLAGAAGRAAQIAGTPINPRVEVLFSNTTQRQFQFDFLFAPSTPQESADLRNIIQTLRFHAAPEINRNTLGGILWTVPSEFDITFYNRGAENTTIPRINTCVLEQIDVDYAPHGQWVTFSTGYPVQIRLQLRFREVEVVHKLRVVQGF